MRLIRNDWHSTSFVCSIFIICCFTVCAAAFQCAFEKITFPFVAGHVSRLFVYVCVCAASGLCNRMLSATHFLLHFLLLAILPTHRSDFWWLCCQRSVLKTFPRPVNSVGFRSTHVVISFFVCLLRMFSIHF